MITKEELTRDSLLEYALVLDEDYANSQGKIDGREYGKQLRERLEEGSDETLREILKECEDYNQG